MNIDRDEIHALTKVLEFMLDYDEAQGGWHYAPDLNYEDKELMQNLLEDLYDE